MNSMSIALESAAFIFSGALLGLYLQRLLPSHHLSKETQDVVKLSAGMVATLTALVLGLLVSSAKGSFDAMSTGIVQSSAKIILLDRALARYGSDTAVARDQLKKAVASTIGIVWPTGETGTSPLAGVERAGGVDLVQDELNKLAPQTDAQHRGLATAQQLVNDISLTRWLLVEQEQNRLPLPLLIILVFWLSLLFVSFGLFAPQNATSVTVLLLGACAVSAAIFLVLELSEPLEGIIQVSGAPLQNALRHLSQ
jgi:hypothetical protein